MHASVSQLAVSIATQVARLSTPSPEMRAPLQHLWASAKCAVPHACVLKPHRYGPLISRAAAAACNALTDDIAKHVVSVQNSLPWVYHYEPRCSQEDLSERVAFGELIGPDGPLHAPDCRVGFTVIAEQTLYPLHAHPAVELYLVISGHAQWQTQDAARVVPPGELVLHRTHQAHAMQTFDEPLLALWGWSGDLDSPAVYL